MEEDIKLIANIDYYLRRSNHERDRYKVFEIMERCKECVCLNDVKALESLLGFDIRRYLLERPEHYLGVDRYHVMAIPAVDRFIRKSVPSQAEMCRKSKYPKIDYCILREVIMNSR